jgi:nucleoside-diphosphate-sugar epimerase
MRYAMTGATGFLGSELARQLRDAGQDVVALVRNPLAAEHLELLGVEMVQGDLDDDTALDQVLAGAHGLFHVAGWYKHGLRERDTLRHVNIDGTRNVLEAAARSGVAKAVYTSTLAVNSDTRGEVVDESYRFTGRHLSEYDRTKAVAHEIALEHVAGGLPLVIVQPGVIYGPDDVGSTFGQLTRQIVRGRRVLGPPRGGGATFAHVTDVARGHVLAMERGHVGDSYILAGPAQTYADVLGLVARLSGGKAPVLLPPRLVHLAARLTAPVERVLPIPQFLTAEAALSGTGTYYGDSTKAGRELGWSPRPLDEGMAETVASIPRS